MKAVVLSLLPLLISSVLALSFITMRSIAEESIYIMSDGIVSPSTAPIQRDGDRYALIANISGGIVVQKDNAMIDGNGYTLQGDGAGKGFDLSNRKNVTVKNAHISRFTYGINLEQSSDNTIINNSVTNCVYGIMLQRAPRSTISNNVVADNSWDGIFATYSDGSILKGNVVANHSKWGLYLGSSTDITLKNNKIFGNRWNFAVSDRYSHDIDASNTIDGKPIYYLVNQQWKQVPSDAGYVALVNSTNIVVRNLDLTNGGQGVVLINSRNCLIENSIITRMGYYAIQLVNSDDNTVRGNTIKDNRPPYFGVGIAVQSDSTGNTISDNLIQNNEQGILFYNSNGNKIYHNNFVGNSVQASSDGSANVWDNGDPSEGNYWSDYRGEDADSDGIGDKPYVINRSNSDKNPFMSIVQIQTDFTSSKREPPHLIFGFAAITIVAMLAYLMKNAMRGNKETETRNGK